MYNRRVYNRACVYRLKRLTVAVVPGGRGWSRRIGKARAFRASATGGDPVIEKCVAAGAERRFDG